jgi:hypothetical protein
MLVLSSTNKGTGAIHLEITTLGIDIAKSVFQLHGVDAVGQVMLRNRLRRNQVLDSWRSCRAVWWALRLAGPRITGRGRLPRLAMTAG